MFFRKPVPVGPAPSPRSTGKPKTTQKRIRETSYDESSSDINDSRTTFRRPESVKPAPSTSTGHPKNTEKKTRKRIRKTSDDEATHAKMMEMMTAFFASQTKKKNRSKRNEESTDLETDSDDDVKKTIQNKKKVKGNQDDPDDTE